MSRLVGLLVLSAIAIGSHAGGAVIFTYPGCPGCFVDEAPRI